MFLFSTAQSATLSISSAAASRTRAGGDVAAASTAAYVLLALPAHIMGFSDVLADCLVVAPWHFVNDRELGQFNDLSALPPPTPTP